MNNNKTPETNWTCIDVNRPINDPRETETSTCEECQKENIPFVFTMQRPDSFRNVFVCRTCAEKMTNDFTTPLAMENGLKRVEEYFCDNGWTYNPIRETYSKRHFGSYITLQKGPYGNWGVFFNNSYHWYYENKKITSLEEAKIAAYNLFENSIRY